MELNMEATGNQDAMLDAIWENDDLPAAQDPAPESEPGPGAEPAEQTQEPSTDTNGQPAADQPRTFTLKNRDETREVSENDLIAMAQKGWDYDTVREERDQLRQYRSEAEPAYALVKDYAKRAGFGDNIPAYLDFCREQELRQGGKTEAEAKTIVAQEKREADLAKRERVIAEKEQQQTSVARQQEEAAQARQRDIQAFYKIYPGVDPKTIPAEVWAAVRGGDTLTNAYTMHENRRLQAELAAERQNKSNHASAPGSLGGNSVTEKDEIDRIWDDDD